MAVVPSQAIQNGYDSAHWGALEVREYSHRLYKEHIFSLAVAHNEFAVAVVRESHSAGAEVHYTIVQLYDGLDPTSAREKMKRFRIEHLAWRESTS